MLKSFPRNMSKMNQQTAAVIGAGRLCFVGTPTLFLGRVQALADERQEHADYQR
jgi:hypothetical protein